MCGTIVWNVLLSTASLPLSFGIIPMSSRPKSFVAPYLPAAKRTISLRTNHPLFKVIFQRPFLTRVISSIEFPKRKVTPLSRNSCKRVAIISLSTKSKIVSLDSISVTGISKALKMEAYSTPITPPPTTAILYGTRFIFKISSLSKTETPSNGIKSGLYGFEPVAIMKLSEEIFISSSLSSLTCIVCES